MKPNIGDRIEGWAPVVYYPDDIHLKFTGVVEAMIDDWDGCRVKIDKSSCDDDRTVNVLFDNILRIIDKKCVCDITTIMWAGCKCGAIKHGN